MGLIGSCIGIWSAAHKPTLKNQKVSMAMAPTAPISTALSFGFVEAGHQDVLTLSPCLKTLMQQLEVMTARKRPRHTPGVTAHCGIQSIGLEIKIIEGNHLDGQAKSRCGSFNPLPKAGFPTSRESTQPDQPALPLRLFGQAEKRQTNRPQPIRRRVRMPSIERHPVTFCLALSCHPARNIAQTKVLEQPVLVTAWNDALTLRIQL